MAELEVRGFFVTGCNQCPFVRDVINEHDKKTIEGYVCRFSNRRFEDPDGRMSRRIPTVFPKFCRLKPFENVTDNLHQRYRNVKEILNTVHQVIEE